MLLPPELEEGGWVDLPDHFEPVHASVAGPAEGNQPGEAGAAGTAMMDDQGRRAEAVGSTEAAQPAVAGDDRGAEAGIEAPVMLLAGVAGCAQAAPGNLK